VLLILAFGSVRSLIAEEEGAENLQYVAGLTRPSLEWPLTVFSETMYFGGSQTLMFPFRLADLAVYPQTYYWDYDTGDFWSPHRRRPVAIPELRPLPAMARTLKNSEQPRLLPESIRSEFAR
jgi:hypothetical protein